MAFTKRADVGRALSYAEADANWTELENIHADTLAARDISVAESIIYPDTAAGLAATAEGGYFVVPDTATDELVFYREETGVAVEKVRIGYRLPFVGGTLTGALNHAPAVSIASAATVAIGAAAANAIMITGTTTITAFDSIADGAVRVLTFAGALTFTHNATSLILPGGANITTAAGDVAVMLSLGSGNWRCLAYQRASGRAVVEFSGGTLTGALNHAPTVSLASAATVNIGAAAANSIVITGTTTITAFDTIANGAMRIVRFTDALILTHSANLVLPSGANITTAADDYAVFMSLGSGVWRCLGYQRASGRALINPSAYDSGDQTITLGGSLSLSHGLGAAPRFVFEYLKCSTADIGYSVNDTIPLRSAAHASVAITSTTLEVRFSNAAQAIPRKDTGAIANITPGSWKWIVRAML